MPIITPATAQDVKDIEIAYAHLKRARELLERGGAEKALVRVRAAVSSCQGAMRHAQHRARRTATKLVAVK